MYTNTYNICTIILQYQEGRHVRLKNFTNNYMIKFILLEFNFQNVEIL